MITHLACIMDGNRRWARSHAMQPWVGHEHGIKAIRRAIDFCLEQKIPYLSLYAFSLENFKRSEQEKSFLFKVIAKKVFPDLDEVIDQGVAIRFVGDASLFPASMMPLIHHAEKKKPEKVKLNLSFLFCYGGQQEIIAGIKKMLPDITSGKIAVNDISEDVLKRYLWTHNIPNPDLIIRTGGVKRLSNFLTFQSVYTELYFTDILWPDLNKDELAKALAFYQSTKRNHGL